MLPERSAITVVILQVWITPSPIIIALRRYHKSSFITSTPIFVRSPNRYRLLAQSFAPVTIFVGFYFSWTTTHFQSLDNNSYPSSLTIDHHSSILPSLTMILLSAHFLLSLHLWSFRLPESALQIINPLLKQFRSLMIPPSVHYYPNIHSLFSRIHSDLSLTQSLTDLIPLTHHSYWPSNYHYLTARPLINSRLQFTNTLPLPIRHSLAFTSFYHSLTRPLTHSLTHSLT